VVSVDIVNAERAGGKGVLLRAEMVERDLAAKLVQDVEMSLVRRAGVVIMVLADCFAMDSICTRRNYRILLSEASLRALFNSLTPSKHNVMRGSRGRGSRMITPFGCLRVMIGWRRIFTA
jgi:hypothetical protein